MTRAAEAAKQRKIERLTKKLKSNSEVLSEARAFGFARLPDCIKIILDAMAEEIVAIENHLERLGVKVK